MHRRTFLLMVATAATIQGAGPSRAADDTAAIRKLLMATFDRPEAPLIVDPVVVVADHAVAGWTQADLGGRALLRRGSSWRIMLCAGDELRNEATLRDAGLAPAEAATLASALAAAEARIDPARVAMFARFDGIVRMDAEGGHPTGHGASHGHGGAQGHGGAPGHDRQGHGATGGS